MSIMFWDECRRIQNERNPMSFPDFPDVIINIERLCPEISRIEFLGAEQSADEESFVSGMRLHLADTDTVDRSRHSSRVIGIYWDEVNRDLLFWLQTGLDIPLRMLPRELYPPTALEAMRNLGSSKVIMRYRERDYVIRPEVVSSWLERGRELNSLRGAAYAGRDLFTARLTEGCSEQVIQSIEQALERSNVPADLPPPVFLEADSGGGSHGVVQYPDNHARIARDLFISEASEQVIQSATETGASHDHVDALRYLVERGVFSPRPLSERIPQPTIGRWPAELRVPLEDFSSGSHVQLIATPATTAYKQYEISEARKKIKDIRVAIRMLVDLSERFGYTDLRLGTRHNDEDTSILEYDGKIRGFSSEPNSLTETEDVLRCIEERWLKEIMENS